jgi:hypothetical protein
VIVDPPSTIRPVLEEAAILDRDRCLADPRRHLVGSDRLTVALRRDHAEQRSVGGIDERVLADPRGPERAQVA